VYQPVMFAVMCTDVSGTRHAADSCIHGNFAWLKSGVRHTRSARQVCAYTAPCQDILTSEGTMLASCSTT
jgi:hypothetical protein